MTLEELKIRRLTNQYLINKSDKLTVIRDLNGFQAQFMVNALHSLKIRCFDYDESTVKDGLVKNWTVRGTVHVFAESDLPLFKPCGTSYHSYSFGPHYTWQRPDGSYLWYNDGTCKRVYSLTSDKQEFLSKVIVDSLGNGYKTREELKNICRKSGMTELEESVMFDQWGGGIRDLCERVFMNYVVQEKKAYCICPPFTPMIEEDSRLEIAKRYFTNIAPATIKDAAYYFGTKQAQIKEWLSKLPVSSFECGGKTYYYIENGKTYDKPIPDCIFFAGFDQLMLGYEKKESIFLKPEHLRGIFNLAGIVMPPILLHGNVIGKWKKKNKKLCITLFEEISARDTDLIKDTAQSLWNHIGTIEFN